MLWQQDVYFCDLRTLENGLLKNITLAMNLRMDRFFRCCERDGQYSFPVSVSSSVILVLVIEVHFCFQWISLSECHSSCSSIAAAAAATC